MEYFPIFTNLHDKTVLVIGDYSVLEFKIEKFIQSGARVKYVSEFLPDKLEDYKRSGKLTHYKDSFKKRYLRDIWLVICGSSNANLKAKVGKYTRKSNIFCNFVDEPSICSFISPALLTKGDITIAISTGGKSPALIKYLKQKIESSLGNEYEELAALLGKVRQRVIENLPDQKQRSLLFDTIIEHPRILDLIKSNQQSVAEQEAHQLIDEALKQKKSLK